MMLRLTRSPCSASGAVINSKLIVSLFLGLIVSCGQTNDIGDKLSQGELDYLRQRAAEKCREESASDYNNFISSSNSNILNFRRDEIEWNLQYKVGTNVVKTHKIFVWKRSPNAVYLRILTSESTPKNIFIKFSTTATRDLMNEVKTDGCAGTIGGLLSKASSSGSSVVLGQDDKNFTPNGTETQSKIFRTYSFSAAEPAFFGFLKFKYTKQYYDLKGNSVSTPAAETESYEVASTAEEDQLSDVYSSNVHYPNRRFCLVADYTAAHIDVLTLSNLQCDSSDTSTVTVGAESFSPGTELTNPDEITL